MRSGAAVGCILILLVAATSAPAQEFSEAMRLRFDSYRTRSKPKAFAWAPGTEQSWQSWGFPTSEENQQVALEKCGRSGPPCVLYAIDDEIVWQADADPARPVLRRPLLPEPRTGIVRAKESLRLRRWPTAMSASASQVKRGAELRVTGQVPGLDWYEVVLPDRSRGYVLASLVEGEVKVPVRETLDLGVAWSFIDRLRGRAEAGEANAQWRLGLWYDNGFGVERDSVEARRWLDRAAAQGHVDAAYQMGLMYELGQGVETDLKEALRYFAISAKGGHDVSIAKLTRYRPLLEGPAAGPPAVPRPAGGPAPP